MLRDATASSRPPDSLTPAPLQGSSLAPPSYASPTAKFLKPTHTRQTGPDRQAPQSVRLQFYQTWQRCAGLASPGLHALKRHQSPSCLLATRRRTAWKPTH